MEEFKEVMLSEPPVRGYVPSSHAGAPSGGGGRSFENYKGILLCDRPTDNKLAVGVAEQPFLPPGKSDRDLFGMGGRGEGSLGLQPSQERLNRNTVARQARHQSGKATSTTALSKHKKWLKELSTVTKHIKLGQVEADLDKEVKQKRFQESERKKRLAVSEATRDHSAVSAAMGQSGAGGASCYTDSQSSASNRQELRPSPPSAAHTAAAASVASPASPTTLPPLSPETNPSVTARPAPPVPSAAVRKPADKAKPKWAMTEDEAFESEMREAQKLVDFAMNLDYDKFIDDYEVREALSIMRQRVENLAEEKHIEPLRHADEESVVSTADGNTDTADQRDKPKRHRRRAADLSDRADWDASSTIGASAASKLINDDALRLAEYILNKSENLRQVHSKLSLAKVLQNIALNKDIPLCEPPAMPPGAKHEVQQPYISDQGASLGQAQKARILTELKQSKEYVQNLPYLYRCPSI